MVLMLTISSCAPEPTSGGGSPSGTPPLVNWNGNSNGQVVLDVNNEKFGVTSSERYLYSFNRKTKYYDSHVNDKAEVYIDGRQIGLVTLADAGGGTKKVAVFAEYDSVNKVYKALDFYTGENGRETYRVTSKVIAVVAGGDNVIEEQEPRPEITFQMTDACNDGYITRLRFFSPANNWVWPSNSDYYVLSGTKSYKLNCTLNDKICFGAENGDSSGRYWGVGLDGEKGCEDCCYQCNGITAKRSLGCN